MTFLERFKGRTGFVTKEGISSLMSEASLPVEKNILHSQEDQPTNRKKSRTVSYSSTARAQQSETPKAQTNSQFSTPMKSATPKAVLDRSPAAFHKAHTEQGLKVSTDKLFFQKDKQAQEFEQKRHFLTPQHKYIPVREPQSADTWSFSQRINDLKNNSRLLSNLQIARNHSSTTPKQGFENSGLVPMMRNMSNQSLHTPTNYSGYKFFGDYNQEPQDLRQSHMDYFDRQEQVVSKYKNRTTVDNGSRTLERAAYMVLSPKHNKL